VLANAIPGIVWGLGYILLAIIGLSRAALPRRSSGLVLVGAIMINLPPEPVGPAPLWLIAAGSVVMGAGLAWWGVALRSTSAGAAAPARTLTVSTSV
jgi:drug/metabolite transporter (DMT)-like permease